MLDLGRSFLASVERDPHALAIVDSDVRLTYRDWYAKISSLVAALDDLGLKPGERLVTVLQNRWEAATVHWACQFAGIIVTPLNWRAKPDEIDFGIDNAEGRALIFHDVSAEAVASAKTAAALPRIAVDCQTASAFDFGEFIDTEAADATPRADAEAYSLMLYTSGTTSRPKGVPRRHRAERAAAVAHVAQNLYRHGECTLGVMPLYHTMGVRSLLAMSLLGGTFVCLPQFDVERALQLIASERVTNLYLVPTLYHDLVHDPRFVGADVGSVRKLGFAGAPMTDALLKKLDAAFRPDLFVNHYGSSEIYTVTIDQDAAAKPGSAGRAGINQMVRVVRLGARSVEETVAPGEEGEIIALLAGDGLSKAIGAAPMPMTRRSVTAGILPAIPGLRTPTATCLLPAESMTSSLPAARTYRRSKSRAVCRSIRRSRRSRSPGCPMNAGEKLYAHLSKRAPPWRPTILTRSAANRAWQTSSGHAVTFSSPKSRNRRLASCCAASSWPANIGAPAMLKITSSNSGVNMSTHDLCRPASRDAQRLPRGDRSPTPTRRRYSGSAAV
jgi:2-furoate---CoA ligase